MAEHDGDWLPDLPDEALEQHLSQLSTEDEQLVRALHEQYSLTRVRQARTLARGWERIRQASQAPAVPFTYKVRQDALAPAQDEMKRNGQMREIPSGPRRPGRLKRMVTTVAAAALLVIIVGGLALVYGQAHSQTNVGSPNSGGPITVTPAQASATPIPPTLQPTGTTPLPAVTPDIQESRDWPKGTDTYWANLRYHQLTGYWVPWSGPAFQWVAGAYQAGWHVSTSPHIPSIVVLMPGVQRASVPDGHVGIAEHMANSTTVYTSNMNWLTDGGGFNKVSYTNFIVSPGIYFLWR